MSEEWALLGRDELLDRCRAGLADGGGGVLLTGPAGIGKSAVLEVLAGQAAAAGELVLRANSSATEAALPYLALYDLFARAIAERPGLLAPHLRAVLDVALLRTPGDGRPTDQLAIRVAVLELLRALAERQPVLLVLDDVNCLDAASAEVLAFAARRLTGHRIKVAATERVADGGEPGCLELLPEPRTELPVATLPGPVIGELLWARLGITPGAANSERIQAASGGNPYYAMELARAARRAPSPPSPDDPLPVPGRLRGLLADRLAALPEQAVCALLLLAAAARPHPPEAPEQREALAAALAAGVLTRGLGGELRFAHPLLREIIYADATERQRRDCHAQLAEQLGDPLERARHRALASPDRGAALAAELAAAAQVAVHRGAPALAAELSQLAADRTPAEQGDLAAERLLAAARHAHDAGLLDTAKQACAAVLHGPDPAARVGARLLLVELAGNDRAGVPALLDAAEADAAGQPRLRAAVQIARADHALCTGRTEYGLAVLAEAEYHAERSGDLDQQIEVIALRAPIEMQLAPERVLPALRRAGALSAGRPAAAITAAGVQLRCCLVISLLRGGETAEAIEAVNRLRADVEAAGRVKDLGQVLHLAASVHERAGRCAEAHQVGLAGGRLRLELGPTPGPGLVLSAAAELNGGTVERATELADAALRAGQQADDTEWSAYALGLRGRADLLAGRIPQAAEHLLRCRELLRGLGYTDPALFLVDADLVEALALAGQAERAATVLAEARAEAARLDRRVILLGLARAEAVLAGLAGDPRGAADRLRAELPAGHPYPLEAARARLALAELERRSRRRAAARAELATALQAFTAAHCLPWAAYARERLLRLDGPSTELTELERQIVQLVRGGATNRQIAAALHVSVKSVEAGLTRLYRRFGVRDRSGLMERRGLAERRPAARG
ncbi:AAA family ATPase [Kitasatospora viridis]|uniref:Regulatory LuxR family protein n=1 Tax=Kitasatospora viridis TaxID=281105 RepID=A0A561UBU9_9ACTN|nr:LuxR family transcriptional regulator [Kitasatospora viridis]TWF96831.1 regulatory LuxR family protein [Kitasatospora viridis]